MAHIRLRYLKKLIEKGLTFSPITGLLGHRQVGKTTLLEQLVKVYTSLDDQDTLTQAHKNPKAFIADLKGLSQGIDECQLEPKLFPALKERVRKDKRPGQFVLSGSVRFTSKKSIQESLTGRIINFELIPFTISELNHRELPTLIQKVLQEKHLEILAESLNSSFAEYKSRYKDIQNYFNNGGLPGICFLRDEKIRKAKIQDQLQTILDRDFRKIYPTTLPYVEIFDYLKLIAETQGVPLNYSFLRKKSGISEVTQKKLLVALESLFLIRLIQLKGKSKGYSVYLEDQAESKYLHPEKTNEKAFEELIYRHLRASFMYTIGEPFSVFQYVNRGQVRIPMAFECQKGIAGILPIKLDLPNRTETAHANAFLKSFKNSIVVMVSMGTKTSVTNERTIIIPAVFLV